MPFYSLFYQAASESFSPQLKVNSFILLLTAFCINDFQIKTTYLNFNITSVNCFKIYDPQIVSLLNPILQTYVVFEGLNLV